MRINHYPDCCAFKIACDLYDLNDAYMTPATINARIKRIISITQPTREFSASRDYNNHVLIAVNHHQRHVIPAIRKYIKNNKIKNTRIKKLTSFINPKSSNKVELYMIYNTLVHNYTYNRT